MEYLPENRNFDWYLFIREHINFSHSWISLNWGYECNTFLDLGSNWIAIWLVKLTIPFLAFNTYPQFFLMVKQYLLGFTLSEKRIKIRQVKAMCKAESNKFLVSHEICSQTAPGNVYPKLNVKIDLIWQIKRFHSLEVL